MKLNFYFLLLTGVLICLPITTNAQHSGGNLVSITAADTSTDASQDTTGASLSGVVTDQTGAALPDVAVTIKNVDIAETRTVATDGGGRYQASGLRPGRFEIRAAKQGFADETRARISLSAGQGATVDIKMVARTSDPCTSGNEFLTTDCTLTWHGITLYGAYDIGVGWVSHGLPVNGYNYEGESLVNRNGAGSRFLVAPNNLQQTGFGIKGKEEFLPGWYVVFNASTGINPKSGLLANAPATNTVNNGLPRSSYSEAIDGARAGQPFNDEYYGGVSSDHFGTLTFGRQRSLGTDAMLLYDPVGGGYGFSYIGYNGTMAGGGDTDDSRWDDALKYRFEYGPIHVGGMYKFVNGSGGCFSAATSWTAASCTPERPHNNAYGFDFGGEHGRILCRLRLPTLQPGDQRIEPLAGASKSVGAISVDREQHQYNPITGANLIDPNDTVYGIVTDNNAIMVAAKYKWDPFKFFAGYEYIWQNNPSNPLGVGATDQGGYIMSGVEDNNLDSEKLVQIWWTGVKYTYRAPKPTSLWPGINSGRTTSVFRQPARPQPVSAVPARAPSTRCRLYVDHHFTKRFDGYAGIAYSYVDGGLAIAIPHGPGVPYIHHSNFAPTIGVRFAF